VVYHLYSFSYSSNSTLSNNRYLTSVRHTTTTTISPPDRTNILIRQYEITESRAYQRLLNGLKDDKDSLQDQNTNNFRDLIPAIYVHPSYAHVSDGKGNTEKYFVGVDAIRELRKSYVVYTAGVNGLPNFENYMSKLGASVYAFDCTDWKRPEYLFEFYDWCIGKEASFQNNAYSKRKDKHTFFSLSEIQQKLNHSKIHMLKMDIEGFEWNLLYSEIISQSKVSTSGSSHYVRDSRYSSTSTSEDTGLPDQLLFELHTEGSNPECVPSELVKGKKRHQVNLLVYQLWALGYRLMNVEVNVEDAHCAELAFIKVA